MMGAVVGAEESRLVIPKNRMTAYQEGVLGVSFVKILIEEELPKSDVFLTPPKMKAQTKVDSFRAMGEKLNTLQEEILEELD